MFEQVLQMVKDHLGGNQNVTSAIPQEHTDAVHQEIATHITQGLQNQASSQGGFGGLLSSLEGGLNSESPITSAISGGLAGSLMSKFGLPAAATGAITAMLPGLLQKFAHNAQNSNNSSSSASNFPESTGGSGFGNIL